jgi:protein SCO1/2
VHPRVLIALFLAAVLAFGAVVLAAIGRSRDSGADTAIGLNTRFAGAMLPEGVPAPDFTLRNQDGEVVSMRDFRGRPVVVTFLYTSCEESCPPQAQQIKGALDDLGHEVPALAITVDPDTDTPERARHFLAEQRMAGRMDFVLGSREEVKPLWEGYAIQPQLENAEHQARIVLVDKRGFQRIGFPLSEATPERITHDLRLLAAE